MEGQFQPRFMADIETAQNGGLTQRRQQFADRRHFPRFPQPACFAPFRRKVSSAIVLFMTDYKKPAFGIGGLLAPIWGFYSITTTAQQLPEDASLFAKMLADPPIYLPWLLTSLVVGFWVYYIWFSRPVASAEEEESTKFAALTHGENSPAISGQIGSIHFVGNHFPTTSPKQVSAVPEDTLLIALGCLDGNLRQKLNRVRQAAAEGRLELWGRREIKPTHLKSPLQAVSVWTPILPGYWEDHCIDVDYSKLASKYEPQTVTESGSLQKGDRYWELRLSKAAVETQLGPVSPVNQRPNPKPLRPDVKLNELIKLIAARKGFQSKAGRDDSQLIKDIQLEILDEIRFSKLTVWGRFQDRALRELDPKSLEDACLDIKRGKISIPHYSGTDVYSDIRFYSLEVARAWPDI